MMANNINHHQHLIMDIVSRLPVESVFRCRCVCKNWRSLLHEPYFTQMHTDTTLLQQQHPAAAFDSPVSFFNLIYHIPHRHYEVHLEDYYIKYDDEQHHQHTSYNHKKVISTNKYHKKVISRPVLNPTPLLLKTGQYLNGPSWLILGSCNGLICFYGDNRFTADSYIIYNPITNEYVSLRGDAESRLDTAYYHKAYGFGYHPSKKEYKIVKIIFQKKKNYDYGRWRIHIYTLGSGKWRIKKQEAEDTRCPPFFYNNTCRGVYVNGAIYWVTRVLSETTSYDMAGNMMTETHIVSFDLADEMMKIIPSPPPQSISDVRVALPSYLCSFDLRLGVPLHLCNELGVLEQHLCMFQHATLSTDIWVMNHNNNKYGGDDQCLWRKKFSIPLPNPSTYYEPIGLTKKGAVLCFCDNSYLISFDPRTKTLESMGKVCLFDAHLRTSYTKSIVSLKALGEENAEIVQDMKKKKHSGMQQQYY